MANRFLVLIIGVLLGIIIGGGIFWYLSGFSGKNIFIVNQQSSRNKEDNIKPEQNSFKEKKKLKQVKKQGGKLSEIQLSTDSLHVDIIENAEEKIEINRQNELLNDTNLLAYVGDSALNNTDVEEQIIVKKDELLSAKSINLIDLSVNKVSTKLKKDSLAQVSSGIKEPELINTYIIEFWKSPINYRGYKMGRNKLVIFGLQETESPKLFKINDNLFLKNLDKVYKVQKNTDFRSLELVSDPEVLNLINRDS